jgi:SAM-dependent methyltransferase
MQKSEYSIMYHLEDVYWWFLAKRKFVASILPKPNRDINILDIGAGTGGMTKFLEKWGNVSCIEPSRHAHPYLKKRSLSCSMLSIEQATIKNNSYDLICLFDVLYHKNISSDEKVLQKAFRGLRSGGKICITDCAIPSLRSHHDEIMHARQRYSKNELTEKVRKVGFVIERSSYIYGIVFPIFLLQRLANKRFKFKTVANIPNLVNLFLLALCSIEAYILKFTSIPIGSSILIFAKRP